FGQAAGDQLGDAGADLVEALAHGQPLGVPAPDAFQDHRELEVREGEVPVEPVDTGTAVPGVPLDQVGPARPAGQATGAGRERVAEAPDAVPVHTGGTEVGQRVAERGHLPVQYGPYPAVRHDRVVQPVVAVHDRRV